MAVEATGTGLGATIRTWRDRLPPSATGLPARHGRRAAGLRREELAELAGLSVDYVVRLEQGRATSPSAQVVTALARALQLTPAERDHLFTLAHLAPPTDAAVPRHIPRGVQRVLARQEESAVGVFAADWQLLWWNRTWTALLGDPSAIPPASRNFARTTFLTGPDAAGPDAEHRLSPWPVTSLDEGAVRAAVVADLRRATGRFPRDRHLARLVDDLVAGSAEFARLWATGAVGAHREDRKVVEHPSVGPVALDCDVLTDGDADLKIVMLTAVPGTEDETNLRLAVVAGAAP